jgi:hypothetical protein
MKLCCLSLLSVVGLLGQEAVLVGDTYVAADAPGAAFGWQERMVVDGQRRGLVQFRLPEAPRAALRSATLQLFANQVVRAGSIEVTMLAGTWDEWTVTQGSVPALARGRVGGVTVGRSQSYVAVDVTELVAAWLGGARNHGFLLAAETAGTSVIFDTKESTGTSHPAMLELSWEGPVGPVGPMGPAGPAGPEGAAGPKGPAGVSGAAAWRSEGGAMDLRRIATRRWGRARGPVQRVPRPYLTPGTEGPVNGPVALETDGESIYLLLTGEVTRIRSADGSVDWSQNVSGYSPYESPAGQLLHDGGTLWRLQGDGLVRMSTEAGNSQLASMQSGGMRVMAFDGRNLWMGGEAGVRRLQGSGEVAAENGELEGVTHLVWDGEAMWAAVAGRAYRLGMTAEVEETVEVCGGIAGMVFDGEWLWASCPEERTLTRWEPGRERKQVEAESIDTGERLGMLEFDGASVWAIRTGTNEGPSFVRVSRGGQEVEAVTFEGMREPALLRFDGVHLWALMRGTMPGEASGVLVRF